MREWYLLTWYTNKHMIHENPQGEFINLLKACNTRLNGIFTLEDEASNEIYLDTFGQFIANCGDKKSVTMLLGVMFCFLFCVSFFL